MALTYGLIVSDFDGTLRRTEGGISERNVRAIGRYVDAGGVFAFCTGRMLSSIMPYAKELGLKGLVAAYQGATIADIESGALLRDERMETEGAAQVCAFLQSLGRHIHVYDGDTVYMNRDDEFKRYYEDVCGVSGVLTGEDIASFVTENNIRPQKVLAMNDPEDSPAVFERVRERFAERFDVTSSSDYLVEINSFGCNKGGALEFLSGYYKIPLDKTIAIGDNYNDIPMIERAGLGVAMENGVEKLKKAADFVTKTCDEDGVAYVIEKFGLGGNI